MVVKSIYFSNKKYVMYHEIGINTSINDVIFIVGTVPYLSVILPQYRIENNATS